MKKVLMLIVFCFALFILGCIFAPAEEVTVGTNTVQVLPSFGTATQCSVFNYGTNTVYIMANVNTLVETNAIPLVNVGSLKTGYSFKSQNIYHILLKTTNGTSQVAIAFE